MSCKQYKKIHTTISHRTTQIALHTAKPLLALATLIVADVPAQAITFNFTYQPGITQEQIAAVELAGNIWSAYLQDIDVVVNIHVEMTEGVLAQGKLGGTTPAIKKINYDKFKEGLSADGTANIYQLPTSIYSTDKYRTRLAGGIINNSNYELLTTTANNKALGNDLSGDASELDAYIQLEKSTNWSYRYAGGKIEQNQYDFVSVAIHEIGHSLGFISGIDALSGLALPTAVDMFRYSTESTKQRAIDYTVGGTKYFSINGGQNPFNFTQMEGSTPTVYQAIFSSGENTLLGGDGEQASHWKIDSQTYLGIMSSTISMGGIRKISRLDLTVLDYIGWQVDYFPIINLSVLSTNAQTKAQKIWDSQFDSNTNNDAIRDRSSDVQQMMQESGIYYWGWSGYWQTAHPAP
ncbi:NF038122 family metalloprotease [Anabaena sp. CCY 9910]|uniref:NF038122 family metalloprotease n=1 Tax=Anabaena sp. CCY 9910 TaxID=3103870 RepID=UPI0039E12ADA